MNILHQNVDDYLYSRKNNYIIAIPIGCIENHGHLPLGTDSLIANKLGEHLVEKNDNLLLTPTINYGCHSLPDSGGGFHMPGTICMDNIQFTLHLEKIVESYIDEGYKKFMFLNCHFENNPHIIDTITRIYKKYKNNDLKIINLCYWDLSSDNILNTVFPDGFNDKKEHGGKLETSIMMYLYPELTKSNLISSIKPSNQFKYNKFDFNSIRNDSSVYSVLSDPTGSSSRLGKLLWDEYIKEITLIIEREFK